MLRERERERGQGVVELENKKGISVFSMIPCWLNRPVIDYNAKEIFRMFCLRSWEWYTFKYRESSLISKI